MEAAPQGPTPPSAAAAIAPSLARRVAPIALVTLLGGTNAFLFQRDVGDRERARESEAAAARAEKTVADAAAQLKADREELARVSKERERLEGELATARQGGTDEASRIKAEKATLEKRLAELADKLGESESARATAEKRASELDEVMAALRKRRINPRRLAGLEAPPRITAEVVTQDERRVPPVLVVHVHEDTTGLEEGDVLYLVREDSGQEREAGRALVERIDAGRKLVQARVARLEPGEKIAVGDRFTTVAPAK